MTVSRDRALVMETRVTTIVSFTVLHFPHPYCSKEQGWSLLTEVLYLIHCCLLSLLHNNRTRAFSHMVTIDLHMKILNK